MPLAPQLREGPLLHALSTGRTVFHKAYASVCLLLPLFDLCSLLLGISPLLSQGCWLSGGILPGLELLLSPLSPAQGGPHSINMLLSVVSRILCFQTFGFSRFFAEAESVAHLLCKTNVLMGVHHMMGPPWAAGPGRRALTLRTAVCSICPYLLAMR